MPDQIRKVWDKSAIATYLVIALLLAGGCGYSICAMQGRQALMDQSEQHRVAMLELGERQRKERDSLKRAHTADIKYLRAALAGSKEIIARQSDQLANAGIKSAEGAKAAVDLLDKTGLGVPAK